MQWTHSSPSASGVYVGRYSVAIVAVALALLIKLLLNPLLLKDSPFLVFFAAVTVSAWYGGFGPGIAATLLSTLLSAIFFFTPTPSLEVSGGGNQVELAVFMLEAGAISGFSGALRSARWRAEQAVQVRDHFLAVAAHELKTPLTSLLGYTQTLLRRLVPGATITERDRWALQVIDDQTRRLHQLITTLLDLSRIHAGTFSLERNMVDIVGLVRRVVAERQPILDRHTVEFSGPDTPLLVKGDELRLEQVFQNLIHNAIKYSPYGGTVAVQVEQRDQHVCILISDQGIGIREAARDRIFQPYYRSPDGARAAEGMGIGLSIVQEIVTLHGGTVELTRTGSEGSTFTVCLPRPIPDPAEQGQPSYETRALDDMLGSREKPSTEEQGA